MALERGRRRKLTRATGKAARTQSLFRTGAAAAFAGLALVGCVVSAPVERSAPPVAPPVQTAPNPAAPSPSVPDGQAVPTPQPEANAPIAPVVRLAPVSFDALPGWSTGALGPGLAALEQSCQHWQNGGNPARELGQWAGTAEPWLAACGRLQSVGTGQAKRDALMQTFVPMQVQAGNATTRLTGYYEPEIDARRAPEPGFEAAIPGIAPQMVRLNFGRFRAEWAGQQQWAKVRNSEVVPLPERADLDEADWTSLGYADPIEVFFLQVQGSGRLRFEDGRTIRAVFAAHNNLPFVSLARHLIDTGEIERAEAGMEGLKAWLRRVGPLRAQTALNVNPRFVWFRAEPLDNPLLGPVGSLGVPLTAFGSMAVDRAFHPLGVPFWVDTRLPLNASGSDGWQGMPWQGLVVAQDTGGAILGPIRGDLFFGTGEDAGRRAGRMLHDMQLFALVPLTLAENADWQSRWVAQP